MSALYIKNIFEPTLNLCRMLQSTETVEAKNRFQMKITNLMLNTNFQTKT